MEYALHLPISSRSLAIPLAAALLGAGVATGTYALADNGQASQPTVVITQPSGADATAQGTPMSSGPRLGPVPGRP